MRVRRINLREQKYGYDIGLLFVTIFLCIFGLIMIYSASYYTAIVKGLSPSYYLNKQLVSTLIGLGLLLVMAAVPYRIFSGWLSVVAYGVGLVLILLTTFTSLGHTAGGRTRWITLFGQTFQTAEIVKVGVIAMLAWLVMRFARKLRGWKLWLIMLGLSLIPALLVFCVPAVVSAWFARRAASRGDRRGWVPAVLLGIIALAFIAMNVLAGLGFEANLG